ncbi:MAG: glycosyl hydrolase, partial [Ktedonobacteraceae bacterium]
MSTKRIFSYVATVALWSLLVLLCAGLFQNLLAAHADHPTVPSTIFLDTTSPAFTITTAASSGTLSYTVTDLSGSTVTRGQAAVMSRLASFTLPWQPDGYYVLQITDHTGASPLSQSIPFAVVAPFTQDAASPFGVGAHFMGGNNPGLAQLITTMGIGSVRDDAPWAMIEKAPGSYSFNNIDPSMQLMQQNNIDPLLILDYNNRFYDNGNTPYDNAGLTAFANYARALVTHYGPQLKAVEVYNEYNGMLSTGPCARKPSCYAQMLRYTYQAIKSIRPDVTVVGGAVFYADLHWFSELFQSGALPYMDVISDHPYAAFYITSPELQGIEEQMRQLQDLVKHYNHGQAKPIWITEIGWSTSSLHVSERTQANYLVRSTILSLAAGVQKIFWYDFLNDGTDTSQLEQNFGLLRKPDAHGLYTPKPAYVAYAVLIRQLAHRMFTGSEAVTPGIYDMRFSGNLRVLWSTPFNQSVALSTNAPVTAISMTGRRQTLNPSGGHIILNLSAEPVYILGNVSSVSW